MRGCERAQRGDEQQPDDQVACRPDPQQLAADRDGPRPGHGGDEDDEGDGRPQEIQEEYQGRNDGPWRGMRGGVHVGRSIDTGRLPA